VLVDRFALTRLDAAEVAADARMAAAALASRAGI
jgi:hypothetical protein